MRRKLRLPPVLSNLFRDLRDRRLLPLAAVLGVAILAVPFAFSKSESPPPAPSPAPQAGANGSTFAVVADDPGLRDYQRRLAGDSPKNPFTQQFAPSDDGSGGSTTGGSTTGGEQGGSGESTGGGETTSGGEGGQPTTPEQGSEPVSPDDGGEPEPAYVVHLHIGPSDDMQPREVSEPTPLPSLDNPVIVFRHLGSEGHGAIFRVGESVSAIYGDAKCLKGTDRCELVEVDPGSPVMFVYGDPERSLMLKIDRIEHNR
jgi:hypothetical protein